MPASGYTALQLDITEVYCVEGALLQSGAQTYQFYSYENSLESYYTSEVWQEVTWLANYGLSNNTNKELVQKTLWDLLAIGDVNNFEYQNADAHSAYDQADNKSAFINDWLLAVTPIGSLGHIQASQNYLVKATATAAPVPEPTTTMLFALGVVGFAGIARRRVTNK